MANIGIIGSGNVGANTAFFIAERSVADVVLFDIKDGTATGKALDMMEAAPVRGYKRKISGASSLTDLKDSDLIIITAGSVRDVGMKREDLFAENKSVIESLARDLGAVSGSILIVTEPVDLLTTVFAKASPVASDKILGLGGLLDSTRLRFFISRELGVAMENVSAMVIGRHASTMMPLMRYSCVSGVPVTNLLSEEKLKQLEEETRSAGDLIVQMAQRASAYYAPSAAAADIADSIVNNNRHIVPVSTMFTGQYGIKDVAMSLPCILGSEGVEKVLEPKLTDQEIAHLKKSATEIEQIIG